MEEKRKDLTSERQKKLLERIVQEMSQQNYDVYYQPTSNIAYLIKDYATDRANLSVEERDLLAPLSPHDIQLLLSLHSTCC